MKRNLLSLGALIAALSLSLTAAQAAPAPGPVRALDNSSDRLLASVKSAYSDMGKRDRSRFRRTVDTVQSFENSVDRLRSAVENRGGARSVGIALSVVNQEYRDVERALGGRGLGREIRSNLANSRDTLSITNRVLTSSYTSRDNDRDDRDDRGRGEWNGRRDRDRDYDDDNNNYNSRPVVWDPRRSSERGDYR